MLSNVHLVGNWKETKFWDSREYFMKFRLNRLEFKIIRREMKFHVDLCTIHRKNIGFNHEDPANSNSVTTWKMALN